MEPQKILDTGVTKWNFKLPIGFLDNQGNLHQEGTIRATNGMDEFCCYKDIRTQENPGYGILILLSRTIFKLGKLDFILPETLENLFLSDLNYLIELYNLLNPPQAPISLSGKN